MQAFSSHDIFQTLYQQIMLLELKPGSTLRENALCEQFGVSRTAGAQCFAGAAHCRAD